MIFFNRQNMWSSCTSAKYGIYTLSGFVLGCLLSLGTLVIYDQCQLLHDPLKYHTHYHESSLSYNSATPEGSEQTDTRQRLTEQVRVLCLVLTCPKYHASRAAHVLATWGRRCDKLLFASSVADKALGALPVIEPEQDIYANLWNKTYNGFRYVYEHHYEEYDWFLKADDDTYVIMENLRYMLYAYAPKTPVIFGSMLKANNIGWDYMSGGSSYVLSKETLRRLVLGVADAKPFCLEHAFPEDVCMGRVLQEHGVHLVDSRFAALNDRTAKFFPTDASQLFSKNKMHNVPDWLYNNTPYSVESGEKCCSKYSVAFHYIDANLMYLYEFLIYHINAFGLHRSLEVLPKQITAKQLTEMVQNNFTDEGLKAQTKKTIN